MQKLVKNKTQYMHHITIKTNPKHTLVDRIKTLSYETTEVVTNYKVEIAAIEDIFVHTNARGALLLGQARGALISSLVTQNIPVVELTALQIKKAITGYGRATKEQVNFMVQKELNIKIGMNEADASDALGCAITLCYSKGLLKEHLPLKI